VEVTGSVVVFALSYLAISVRRLPLLPVDRPAVALCGAVAMVAVGGLSLDHALAAIDLHVLGLLFGVMLIASYLQQAHVFRFAAWWVLTRTRSARSLLWALVWVSGGLSALLVNDTVCLVLTPLVIAVVLEAELPPLPYLLALASSTNIGGVVSLSGNPQNMLIGRAAADVLTFADYSALALPAGAACLAVNAVVLCWLFQSRLPRGPLPPRTAPRPYLDRRMAVLSGAALAAFVALALAGVSLTGASLTAAALLVLVARVRPREVLGTVDWPLLVFFAGLFVLVAGLERAGAMAHIVGELSPALSAAPPIGELCFAAISVIGSNAVSNVPFVLVAVDWVPALPDPRWGYVTLAFASTLAGNLTLIGSIANLIVFESAGAHGRIGFWQFLRYGAVLTAGSAVTATAALAAVRWLFG
jgi:Na+/H+ antiporter NhaD/arsenite permease-like protein